MRLLQGVAGVSLILLAACSGAMQQGTGAAPRNEAVITSEELRGATAGSLFEYIRVRRPRWLERSHTGGAFRPERITTVAVFVDNQYFGGPDALRQLPLMAANEVRYYDPSEAQSRFGLGYLNGVIQVITRTAR